MSTRFLVDLVHRVAVALVWLSDLKIFSDKSGFELFATKDTKMETSTETFDISDDLLAVDSTTPKFLAELGEIDDVSVSKSQCCC